MKNCALWVLSQIIDVLGMLTLIKCCVQRTRVISNDVRQQSRTRASFYFAIKFLFHF